MTAAGLSNLVVEVLHNRGDDNHPDWSVGSGFFVGTRLVLTALHNVDGPGELLVRVHGREEHSAVVRLQGDEDIVDLAVLEISDVAMDVPLLRYGAVDRGAPTVVERCWAVGFPRFKERAHNPKPLRLSAQVNGEIPTGENLDQPLLTLQVRSSPRPLPSSAVHESEWAGMSGAAVFSGNNIIVGVVTEHHLPEGESALTVVPITALDLLPEAEATKWWKLLGVGHQPLVRLPGEAPSSLSLSARPKSFIPHPPSTLFQPRPGEFERLEGMLFESKREKLPPRVGLVGMGGVGKSQLAVELADRWMDQHRYPGGIFWMSATGKDVFDWQRQLAALAVDTDYLPPDDNLSSPENERRRARHLCRYLADHRDALLILDNVEDPSLVMTALPALVGGKVACSVLYTSRITLQPEGVAIYPVEQLSEGSALRLLLQETRQPLLAQIEVEQLDTETQSASDVCHLVGYLPLALMLLRGLLKRDRHLTLARLQQELTQHGVLNLVQALFSTFELSWEQIQGEEAQRMFKLACYFPEAARIPLWLLGLAAGLGEEGDILNPLGKARLQLQELSLLEVRSGEEISLHPLVREFGLALVAKADDKGTALLEEAGKRLANACLNLNWLKQRAQRRGYWECLDQVRAMRDYLELLGTADEAKQIGRIEHWLDRESYLLADKQWWPNRLPGLFYQQLYNRAVETRQPEPSGEAPAVWLRQAGVVGGEDQALLRIFAGHTDEVTSVAFSPDGKHMLTGSADKTARLWEASSGRELARLEGHTDKVTSVAFSPDGMRVLTGSDDNTARLWEASSGRELRQLHHPSNIRAGGGISAAFSSDGTRVLTGADNGTVRLWEVSSGRELARLVGHKGWVSGVVLSSDGTHVLTGSHDRSMEIWEVNNDFKWVDLLHTDKVTSVALSPDGTRVLTSGDDGTVQMWEVSSGRELARLVGHRGIGAGYSGVTSIALSPDGTRVLTGSREGAARLWEASSGRELALFHHSSDVIGVAFSPDGTRVLTGSKDGTVRLWEASSGQEPIRLGHTALVYSIAFSPDGSSVLTGSHDGTARLWEVSSGRELACLRHEGWVTSAAYSPDGTRVLTGSADKTARLWEASSGHELARLDHSEVFTVAFSPDGTRILTGSADKTARLWEASSGRELLRLDHSREVLTVAYSPDGTRVLTCSRDDIVRLWEASNGHELARLVQSLGWGYGVAFSPDGTRVLIGSDEETALLWEVGSGRVAQLGHSGGVIRVAFSRDGTLALTGSADKTAGLWEASSGRELARLEDHTAFVYTMAFSPNGRFAITCDTNSRVCLWQVCLPELGRLMGIYIASYTVQAIHWEDATHVVLADTGGPAGYPHFYHLTLEGIE